MAGCITPAHLLAAAATDQVGENNVDNVQEPKSMNMHEHTSGFEQLSDAAEGCKRCQDLDAMRMVNQRMINASAQYLDIIEAISAKMNKLREENPCKFETVTQMVLPQGLKTEAEDPTEMITQLITLFITQVQQLEVSQAEIMRLQQKLGSKTFDVKEIPLENEEKLTKLKSSDVCVTETASLAQVQRHHSVDKLSERRIEEQDPLQKQEDSLNKNGKLKEEQNMITSEINNPASETQELQIQVQQCDEFAMTENIQQQQKLAQQLEESKTEPVKLQKEQKCQTTRVEKLTYEKEQLGNKKELLDKVKDYEQHATEHLKEKEKLQIENEELLNKVKTCEEHSKEQLKENEKLKNEKEELLTKVKTCEKHATEEIKEKEKLKNEKEELLNKVKDCDERATEQLKEKEKLTNENKELLNKVQTCEEHATEQLKEKEKLENEKEELLNKVKTCEEHANQQLKEKGKLENEKEELLNKVKSCEEQLKEKQNLHRRVTDCEAVNNSNAKQIEKIKQWVLHHAKLSCLMPHSAHEDDRITPIIAEFMQILNTRSGGHAIDIIPKAGSEINNSLLPVILPCIAASRVGSDISAALTKAKIASGQVILLIFHHLAPHNCKITTPTEKRLSDRTLLDQCVGMVDAVFWNGAMYDCEANRAAVDRVQELLQWSMDLHHLLELKQLV